jgi:hypothetical protein
MLGAMRLQPETLCGMLSRLNDDSVLPRRRERHPRIRPIRARRHRRILPDLAGGPGQVPMSHRRGHVDEQHDDNDNDKGMK